MVSHSNQEDDSLREKIDIRLFEELCFVQCTLEEMAGTFQITPSELTSFVKKAYGKPFEVVRKWIAQKGQASMRRSQLRLAQKNPLMSIWLGKQYLGQKGDPVSNIGHKAVQKELIGLRTQPRPLQIEQRAVDTTSEN